jgi:hypothetical protein
MKILEPRICPNCNAAIPRPSQNRSVLQGKDGLFRGQNGDRVVLSKAKRFGAAEADWIRTRDEKIVLV